MIGTVIKALAGIFVGAIIGYAISTVGGTQLSTVVYPNTGNFGNVTYGSIASIAVTGVLAFFTRGRGAIGQVLAVAFAFQIAFVLMQVIQGSGALTGV